MRTRASIGTAFALGALLFGGCGGEDEDGAGSGGAAASSGGTPSGGAPNGGATSGGGAAGSAVGGAGSGGSSGAGAGGQPPGGGGGSGVDLDGDGIDDAKELALAKDYFPYYSPAPGDKCPRHGVLFRLAPHPADSTKLAIWYVVLFENDCGAAGHVGDDEVFGAIIDPALPAPEGILALRAISHQGTVCEKTSSCGTLPGCDACAMADKNGKSFPVVFPSIDKHGTYVDEGSCDISVFCDYGGCTLNPTPDAPPFTNAGEPGKPLTNNLTTNGFINAANGWTAAELLNFDPWSGSDFGGAGSVKSDLEDSAFVIAPSGC